MTGSAAAPHSVHLVDDDAAIRDSLAWVLQAYGWRTTGFASAEALLDALPGLAPGCIVIDIRLPGMNGLELQRELRRRGTGMPVIIVTGHADAPLAAQAFAAGAIAFLEKPYDVEAMQRAITAALAPG